MSNLALSRAADRLGARRVLVPAAVGYAGATLALALVPADAFVLETVTAVAMGLSSAPVVSVVRGLWPRILEPEVAEAVYGLEATAQELVFISGRRSSRWSPAWRVHRGGRPDGDACAGGNRSRSRRHLSWGRWLLPPGGSGTG